MLTIEYQKCFLGHDVIFAHSRVGYFFHERLQTSHHWQSGAAIYFCSLSKPPVSSEKSLKEIVSTLAKTYIYIQYIKEDMQNFKSVVSPCQIKV